MPNLGELNAMSREEFTHVVGPVFEHSPWIAERAWTRRPFRQREDLQMALVAVLQTATAEEKLALIKAHPDLVTRTALTGESKNEQRSAGLNDLSAEEAEKFETYNAQYRERFGFPFVICARLNKKEAMLDAFPRRLENSGEEEMENALAEILKIAELRLADLLK